MAEGERSEEEVAQKKSDRRFQTFPAEIDLGRILKGLFSEDDWAQGSCLMGSFICSTQLYAADIDFDSLYWYI
eukprot:3838773-Pyramimonas_sp.AAC.1